jgi:uncharacterized protein (TIGR02266 family)
MHTPTLLLQWSAETLKEQYPRLSTTRIIDVKSDGEAAPGTPVSLRMEVAGEQPLQLTGTVHRAHPGQWQVRVNMGITERRTLEEMFKRAKVEPLPRAQQRFAFVFEADLQGFGPAWVQNISQGGLFIATNIAPPVGSIVRVRLKLPNAETKPEVEARVAWCGTSKENGREGFGVQLLNITPELEQQVAQLLTAAEQRQGKRALVADDDDELRAVLTELLQTQGYDVIQASNGTSARDLALHHVAELKVIVLDLGMPELDGFDVLTQIRQPTRDHGVPIIVITGSDLEKARCARDLGADEAVLKGFSGDEFLALVDSVTLTRPA